MNELDIAIIVLLSWGVYSGFRKGFVAELVSFLLWGFLFKKGVSLFFTLLPIVERYLPHLGISLPVWLALLIILIGGILLYLVTRLIKNLVNITFFGVLDSVLGGVFGLCRISIIISFVFYCWGFKVVNYIPFSSEYVHNSTLFRLLEPIAPKVLKLKAASKLKEVIQPPS